MQSAKRSALLVGATGLVGNSLLHQLLAHDCYSDIATLGRSSPDLTDQRLAHHRVDFSNEWVWPAKSDVVFCCLGTTIRRAGSQKAFRAIDFSLVETIARLAAQNGTVSFIVVSSVGADPESGNFYLRTKGEMEQMLQQAGFSQVGILRPSLLLGKRDDSRPAELLGQYAARLFDPLLAVGMTRYRAVDAETVAAAMIGLDQSGFSGTRIVQGNEIRRLARKSSRL